MRNLTREAFGMMMKVERQVVDAFQIRTLLLMLISDEVG